MCSEKLNSGKTCLEKTHHTIKITLEMSAKNCVLDLVKPMMMSKGHIQDVKGFLSDYLKKVKRGV